MDTKKLHDMVTVYLEDKGTRTEDHSRYITCLRCAFSAEAAKKILDENDPSVLKYMINNMLKTAKEKWPNKYYDFERPDGSFVRELENGTYEVRLAIYDIPSGAV